MSESRELSREAGPELDAEIAERVMGGRWEKGCLFSHVHVEPHGWLLAQRNPERFGDNDLHVYEGMLPCYSTDIAAAFSVVEAMRTKGFEVSIETVGDEWGVRFDNYPRVCAATVPLAVCRAALKAIEPASSEVSGS